MLLLPVAIACCHCLLTLPIVLPLAVACRDCPLPLHIAFAYCHCLLAIANCQVGLFCAHMMVLDVCRIVISAPPPPHNKLITISDQLG